MAEYLSTYTVVAIYSWQQQQKHYFSTKSLIKNSIYLSKQASRKDFQNSLFYIQIEGNNFDFNIPIGYDQPISLKHKISQKYLTITVDQHDQKQIRYKIQLGNDRKYFKINPCYHYQTKISTKIKFNEQIFLSTEYTESRHGMVVTQKNSDGIFPYLGFNFGSKLLFHFNSLYEKEERFYKHGKIIWLSHIESDNYLSLINSNGKTQIAFEPIKFQKQIQNLQALWTIESNDLTESQYLKYDQEIKLKNLFTGEYLSFSKNYKLIDNERIYQIFMEQHCGDFSKFLFKTISQNQTRQIQKNSYLSLLHYESNLFIGCRKGPINQHYSKLLTFPYSEDEDLFRINQFSSEEQQALRFIFAIRKQFKDIQVIIRQPARQITIKQIIDIEQTYCNIQNQFKILKKNQKLFEFVKNQLGSSIQFIADNLSFFRALPQAFDSTSKSNKIKTISTNILAMGYQIIIIFCHNNSINQAISFKYRLNYLSDLCLEVGAQQTLIETFRNNKELLPRIGRSLGQQGNIIRMIFVQFQHKNKLRDNRYWQRLLKIINLLNILLFYNGHTLEMNQYAISQQLFKNGHYEQIFLPIYVKGQKIIIYLSQTDSDCSIENVKSELMNRVIDSTFELFSHLTHNHSFISKHYIHNYLASKNQACLSVFITYLNKPIRKQLYNKLINFVAKTYLDSSPRLKRHKPMTFIFFNFQDQKTSIEQQQAVYTDRLRQMLVLKAQQSNVCKPLHYSNLLQLSNSYQPSMNEEQLVTFRLNLTEKILNSSDCSLQQLQTIGLLMKLQCYTVNQMLQIYQEFKRKLILWEVKDEHLPKILEIIEQLFILMQQLQMKKLKIYLQHKFIDNKDLPEDQYNYILPLSSRIFIPFHTNSKQEEKGNVNQLEFVNLTGRSHDIHNTTKDKEVKQYNELRDTLDLMHANPQLKKSLMDHFCSFQQKSLSDGQASNYLGSVFNLIIQSNLPKYSFLKLLSKSTILTHDEVSEFDHLFDISKKLQYLILISQSWMTSDTNQENVRLFLRYLNQITNYLFDNFTIGDNHNFVRSKEQINIKKQLLIGSLGVHVLVFQLLQKSYYILQNISGRKDLRKKEKDVFQICFTFIYYFIHHCAENKRLIYEYFSIVLMYQGAIELGQINIYIEFYKDQKIFVKEINFTFIQNVIYKIIKKGNYDDNNEICEYNPDYLQFLIVLIQSLDIESKFFIQKLYQFITKAQVFWRLLFLDQTAKKNKQNQFCLKMHKMKIDPVQVPIIYHQKLLQLFNIILLNSSDTLKNGFMFKLGQIFKIDYLIEVLALPDIFSNFGVEPKLNFLLKKDLLQFILFFLERTQYFTEIYSSQSLKRTLQFYSRIFVSKIDRKQLSNQSESLYFPYLQSDNEMINNYFNNKVHYYHQQVKPFFNKLAFIFQKQLVRNSANTLKQYFQSLHESLTQSMKMDFTKRTTTFGANYGLKDVKLKWRNFVDDDEDNSKEEKYAKKVILDILKSKKAEEIIQLELNLFFQLIRKNSKLFLRSILKLLTILFASKNIDDGRTKQSKVIQYSLKYLSGYISYITDQSETHLIIVALQQNKFIQVFIALTTRKQFELSKIHLKNIYYYCLKILNFLLQKDSDLKFNRLLFRIFQNNKQSYKFMQFLKAGALQVISTIDSNHYYQQINSALQEMSLCVDDKRLNLYQQSYRTLTFLCKYQPFTQYLRVQQSISDIDFLDKIFNVLTFLFSDHHNLQNSIKLSSVRATQYILDFVSSMLTGANKINQNYIIDSKFGRLVNSVLKIQSLQKIQSQKMIRQDLLGKIVQFYKSNGIQIDQLLHSKIKLIDFRHQYLLNRYKYILVKTLLECLIANPTNIAKIKMEIPLQIVKLNFIWIYQLYRQHSYQYKQQYILRKRLPWSQLIEQEGSIQQLFLRLGFYYYQLILIYQEKDVTIQNSQNQQKIINQEKQKERVVKKFFSSIMDKERLKQKQKCLSSQKLSDQMKYYYHTYYNALLFFSKKTGSVQIKLKDNILTVYFPILPLAESINPNMERQFKEKANRLTRDQKIKSLLEYQNSFYQDLKGEDDYFTQIQHSMPMFGPVLRMMQHEDQFLLVAWICNIALCLTYMVQNYKNPSFLFHQQFFFFVTPQSGRPLLTLMLIFSLLNLIIGFVNGVYLFTRKIPLLKKLLSLKYIKMDPDQKKGFSGSQFVFIFSSIFKQTAYNFYIVFFLMMVIVHPFFSAFPLIQVINRIQMGKFIIRSIKETWFQLGVAVCLLIIFNFVFVQLIYDFFTSASGYGPICKSQYTCLLLFTDQNLKGGAGVIGNVTSNYQNLVMDLQLLCQIFYIIFSLKVILQIFSGTIIDKFSQLREEKQSIEEDQNTICFICAQQRFDLDLEYQGFDKHVRQSHNVLHYFYFLFYLRRCQSIEYGIIQRYVHECKLKSNEDWIPEDSSVIKQEKQRQEQQQKEDSLRQKQGVYLQIKLKQLKRIHQRIQTLTKYVNYDQTKRTSQ